MSVILFICLSFKCSFISFNVIMNDNDDMVPLLMLTSSLLLIRDGDDKGVDNK